jgi:enediyne biosynthesis protein CalE3
MHQAMLGDRPRLHAYDRALEQAVGPGDVVVDVGAGTLVLSLLALRHGAGHVYAVEADPAMVEVAARLIEANDLKDTVTLIAGDARTVRLPQPADVLVSELMGNLGPEEQMAELLNVVARRTLRPGGRIVPRGLTTRLAAIEFDAEGWGLWGDDLLGHRFDVVQDMMPSEAHLHFFQREPRLLSEPAAVVDTPLGRGGATRPRPSTRLRIDRPGTLHAVMGFFTADMADDVRLSNFPSYPGCNWAVWIWPLRHSRVSAGDEIRVDLHRPRSGTAARVATDWRLDCGIVRARRT